MQEKLLAATQSFVPSQSFFFPFFFFFSPSFSSFYVHKNKVMMKQWHDEGSVFFKALGRIAGLPGINRVLSKEH